ncbi:MAG: hypothetical protein ACFWUM_07760 [Eubacteriales bacterium]|jgi:hypothetical protein
MLSVGPNTTGEKPEKTGIFYFLANAFVGALFGIHTNLLQKTKIKLSGICILLQNLRKVLFTNNQYAILKFKNHFGGQHVGTKSTRIS